MPAEERDVELVLSALVTLGEVQSVDMQSNVMIRIGAYDIDILSLRIRYEHVHSEVFRG
jgi:hypothetical protein